MHTSARLHMSNYTWLDPVSLFWSIRCHLLRHSVSRFASELSHLPSRFFILLPFICWTVRKKSQRSAIIDTTIRCVYLSLLRWIGTALHGNCWRGVFCSHVVHVIHVAAFKWGTQSRSRCPLYPQRHYSHHTEAYFSSTFGLHRLLRRWTSFFFFRNQAIRKQYVATETTLMQDLSTHLCII